MAQLEFSGVDDIRHYRQCGALTRVALQLRLIPGAELPWFIYYTRGQFGRRSIVKCTRRRSESYLVVQELFVFLHAVCTVHNVQRHHRPFSSFSEITA